MKASKRSYSIVMADGNLEDHRFVKNAARECGINHVFTSVFNGSQLLDYLYRKGAYKTERDVRPDLLFMDIRLEIVNGFDVLERLHRDDKIRFPVYVLTETRREEDVARAMRSGVVGYFQKPLTYGDYVAMVGKICKDCFAYERSGPRKK